MGAYQSSFGGAGSGSSTSGAGVGAGVGAMGGAFLFLCLWYYDTVYFATFDHTVPFNYVLIAELRTRLVFVC